MRKWLPLINSAVCAVMGVCVGLFYAWMGLPADWSLGVVVFVLSVAFCMTTITLVRD